MIDHENGNEYVWDRNRFLNRQVHMQELYQKYSETGEVPDLPQVKHNFLTTLSSPWLIRWSRVLSKEFVLIEVH